MATHNTIAPATVRGGDYFMSCRTARSAEQRVIGEDLSLSYCTLNHTTNRAETSSKMTYEINPIGVWLETFLADFIPNRTQELVTVSTLRPKHHWPEKLANHGVVRKWPLASPISLRRPSQAHRHHPHTMGDHPCAWFGCRLGIGFALQIVRHSEKCQIFKMN